MRGTGRTPASATSHHTSNSAYSSTNSGFNNQHTLRAGTRHHDPRHSPTAPTRGYPAAPHHTLDLIKTKINSSDRHDQVTKIK
jgi:hypothetical protein